MKSRSEHVALVTGAAGDIGAATAAHLAARGWRLALTDHERVAERLDEVSEQCRALGGDAIASSADVTAADAVAAVLDTCCDAFGTPTGLFASAGVQGRFEPIDRYPVDDVRSLLDVNVVGVFAAVSAVARAMKAGASGGSIVLAASMAGVNGAPNMAAYSASKAAVIALAKSAAKDLAPAGIRVNAVSPGFIGPGRMWDRQVEAQAHAGSQYYDADPAVVAEQMRALVPLRRCGTTAEVAAVVAFLLSAESSYLTGINVEVAGGAV